MSSSASEAQTHAMVFLAISTRLFMTEEFTLSLITRIFGVDIVVLSNNYASSLFCLGELAYTLECRERKNLLVLPIFYNLNPSHVRHQKGSYDEALAKHARRFQHNPEKLHKWKMALRQVADLSGF
ncbi:hypothetical protein JHK82_021503 [Glycine max]|nr:hypothetical protein JHK82_021503 [Glycine max]